MTPSEERLETLKRHFFANVFDHTQSEIRAQFASPTNVDEVLVTIIEELLDTVSKDGWDNIDPVYGVWYLDIVFDELKDNDPDLALACFEKMIQLVGSTRSKVITDLKASTNFYVPSQHSTLISKRYWTRVREARDAVFYYLSGCFVEMIGPMYQQFMQEDMDLTLATQHVLHALNIATWQSYTRQEQAKRSGHSAEQDVARFLHAIGVQFSPEELLTNPMCADHTFQGESFDILVPNLARPALAVVSTVHSSNIGQYGESKTGDLLLAKEALEPTGTKLVAFADGVGFHSNTAGLTNVLTVPHVHVQYKTLWKLAMACEVLGIRENNFHYLFSKLHRHHPDDVWNYMDTERKLINPIAMHIAELCIELDVRGRAQDLWSRCYFGPPAINRMRDSECAYTYPLQSEHPVFGIVEIL